MARCRRLSADVLKDAAPALLDEFVHLLNHLFAGDIPDALSMDLITAVLPGRLLCWRVQSDFCPGSAAAMTWPCMHT